MTPEDHGLRERMAARLAEEGLAAPSALTGRPLAHELAELVDRCCLAWRPDPSDFAPEDGSTPLDGILALAFGNRINAQGEAEPGPVNQRLAGVLLRCERALRGRHSDLTVWAQWEIAQSLPAGAMPADRLTVLGRPPGAQEANTYFSTADAVRAVVAACAARRAIAPALLVVAHPDHLRRCLHAVRRAGLRAFAVRHADPDAPAWYDPESGQPWTRTRHLYLVHDMIGRLALHRDELGERAAR